MAKETGIPAKHIMVIENGQIINVKNGKIKLDGSVSSELVFVDGSWVGDLGPDEMRDRTMLSKDGIILVHINLDKKSNEIYGKPEIVSRGFAASQEANEIIARLHKPVIEAVNGSNGQLEKNIIRTVKSFIYNETRRNPTILVTSSKI